MGFIYDIKFKYSKKGAENLFPNILASATVCTYYGFQRSAPVCTTYLQTQFVINRCSVLHAATRACQQPIPTCALSVICISPDDFPSQLFTIMSTGTLVKPAVLKCSSESAMQVS